MKRRLTVLTGALLTLVVACAAIGAIKVQEPYDLIIHGGRVLDGTGNPWYYTDLGITGDRIVAVGDLSAAQAERMIDAGGLYVAPGFIDVHIHAGRGLVTPDRSPAHPLLAQGNTTVVIGPCGSGPVDIAGQREQLIEDGLGVNVAQFIGHNSVRRAVMGMEDRAPTEVELEEMKALIRQGMEDGAFGMSSGPFYVPGSFSETEELVELARVVAEYGGIHESHIRDESDYTVGLIAAVDELIQISREAGLTGVVSHIKALGPRVWGFSGAVVNRIEQARAEGLEIYADQYPYEASSTGLSAALLPRWAQAGGSGELQRRFEDPEIRARIRGEIVVNLKRRAGATRIMFSSFRSDPSIVGKTLQEVAEERGMDPVNTAIELLKQGGPSIISFNMNEADIRTFMRQPWTMTSSDGSLPQMNVGTPHPRSYGTFPRKIRKYVIEEGVIDLAAAVRSMTSLSATVFNIPDRGVLREGAYADVVVFDLDKIRDKSTYQQPHQLAEGMVYVIVNGRMAVDGRQFTGELAGRMLSRR
ncbi:MAG: D-aminoacylase [Candidatus Latescibacteria bacterium]|nr:D-aminoacylase [Candidatus Latescibacterota bacterium]